MFNIWLASLFYQINMFLPLCSEKNIIILNGWMPHLIAFYSTVFSLHISIISL